MYLSVYFSKCILFEKPILLFDVGKKLVLFVSTSIMNYELWNVTEQCTRAYRDSSFPSRTRAPQIAVHRGVGRIDRGVKVKGHPKGRPRGLSNRASSQPTRERLEIVCWRISRVSKSRKLSRKADPYREYRLKDKIDILFPKYGTEKSPKSNWEKIFIQVSST